MKYCKKCVMPDTRPNIVFDENGICSACVNHEKRKSIDWDKRWKELEELADKYRGCNGDYYDCIIDASGGTGFTYDLLKRAKDKKAFTLAITENVDTPLGKYADYILKSDSKPEGHCLHPDTPVMEASRGLTNISNIKPGDNILSVKKSVESDCNLRRGRTLGFFNRGLRWSKVNSIQKFEANKLLEIK